MIHPHLCLQDEAHLLTQKFNHIHFIYFMKLKKIFYYNFIQLQFYKTITHKLLKYFIYEYFNIKMIFDNNYNVRLLLFNFFLIFKDIIF